MQLDFIFKIADHYWYQKVKIIKTYSLQTKKTDIGKTIIPSRHRMARKMSRCQDLKMSKPYRHVIDTL